jgi:hypothetical protein
MKSKAFYWTVRTIAVMALIAGINALAQYDSHKTFNGVINAYSPQTAATLTTPATGPYEVRGPWTLKLNTYTEKANFSAALDMNLSDGWAISLNGSNFDPNARNAHTHHITMVDANVTWTATGFEISGPATVTLNGGTAPVSPTPLVIDITGGTLVKYSNIKLTFGSPGSKHFGGEPLPGVVTSVAGSD